MFTNDQYPFYGYSSRPDILAVYISYSLNDQIQWIESSEKIIQEFIDKIATFENFQQAYFFLAEHRHHLAIKLHQKTEEGRTDYYGEFRNEGEHFRQIISAGEGEQFWKWQKDKIFELTDKIIETVKINPDSNYAEHLIYEDNFVKGSREIISIDDKRGIYYLISVKNPFSQTPDFLSKIELFDFGEDKIGNSINIEYTPIHKKTLTEHYQIANYFYQNLIRWQIKDGVNAFLENASQLSYLLAHLLLVKQGNVSIVEWMLRGIAFKNGIDLGKFNYDEKISWDFKAILTPNIKEYIKWFSTKVFIKITELNKEERMKGFYFR